MKIIKLKRLYNGLASLRSYVVDNAIKYNEPVTIECNGAKMTLTPEQLAKGSRNTEVIHSKFNNVRYTLVDYKWTPNLEGGLFK